MCHINGGKTVNKVVMITGAVRNTGYAAAERFAKEGWNVVITSRSDESAKEGALRLQRAYPHVKVLGMGMHQSNVKEIRSAFVHLKEAMGRLDAFIPNAADLAVGYDVLNTTEEQWNEVMNTNISGTFFCCQEAAKLMIENGGGAITMVSSVHANQSVPGRVAYSASKAAINAIARCMAIELGNRGVRVNSLLAGAIWTQRWANQSKEVTQRRRNQYPVGKESSPEDIANALYFLCSDQSKTVTGTEMTVDSGISICLLPYNKYWNETQGSK